MIFLINLLFALGAGALANYVMAQMGVDNPIRIILAVIIGIVVFMLNLAAYAVQ